VGLTFREQIEHRLFRDDKGSAVARVPLMRLAWDLIVDHPWLGVGVNNYADRMLRHALEDGWTWVAVVHNKYLLVWAETGILGLVAFLWFLLATLCRGRACWDSGDRLLALLAIGFTAGVAGQMVHMFVDIYASRPLVQGLWLVAGLLTAMRHLEDRPNPLGPPSPEGKGEDTISPGEVQEKGYRKDLPSPCGGGAGGGVDL
jgi:O-antigen ligase